MCPQNGDQVAGLDVSEDCLSLNVWVPAPPPGPADAEGALPSSARRDALRGARRTPAGPRAPGAPIPAGSLPVLVFVHGGGFVHGGSAQRLYPDGPRLYDGARMAATQHIVVVTINYRIGVLGFLAGAPGVTPNLGLLDQQLALRWVQRNIGAFGGDPARVTLAGESAGAMSAGLQLLSVPSSAGLFRSVILESDPFGLPYRTAEQARLGADLFLLHVGCKFASDTLACLQHLPLKTILQAQDHSGQTSAVLQQGLPAFLPWAPVVDGRLVVRQPYQAALEGGVTKPLLLGTNGSEGTVFFANDAPIGILGFDALAKLIVGGSRTAALARHYPPSLFGDNTQQVIRAAGDGLFVCPTRAVARAARAPTYLYHFDHRSSFNLWADIGQCAKDACHGAELPFVFGSAGGKMAFTPAERRLSDAMMAAWGAFVRGDGPGPESGSTGWPPFGTSGEVWTLANAPSLAPPGPAACGFWDAASAEPPAASAQPRLRRIAASRCRTAPRWYAEWARTARAAPTAWSSQVSRSSNVRITRAEVSSKVALSSSQTAGVTSRTPQVASQSTRLRTPVGVAKEGVQVEARVLHVSGDGGPSGLRGT